jgi:uncharacterized membrane protein
MILSLFVVLIAISLAFILVGLLKPDESSMALVGFVFLFLLSFVVLNSQLEYETGANVTAVYSYGIDGNIIGTSQAITYSQQTFSGSNAHTMGYYMVIVSIVGFVGVLLGLRSAWKAEKQRRSEE